MRETAKRELSKTDEIDVLQEAKRQLAECEAELSRMRQLEAKAELLKTMIHAAERATSANIIKLKA